MTASLGESVLEDFLQKLFLLFFNLDSRDRITGIGLSELLMSFMKKSSLDAGIQDVG